MPSVPLVQEAKSVWFEKVEYHRAEEKLHLATARRYVMEAEKMVKEAQMEARKKKAEEMKQKYESMRAEKAAAAVVSAKEACTGSSAGNLSSLADEIARARQHIKNSLQCEDGCRPVASVSKDEEAVGLDRRIEELESKKKQSDEAIDALQKHIEKMEDRIAALEKATGPKKTEEKPKKEKAEQPSKGTKALATSAPVVKKEDDDDIDLFGSDEEDDEENEKLKRERLKAYEEKKSKKPALIAKSNVILDVKPWDDETDMKEMERKVREIQLDGLVWGASKLVPLAYGIHKLQISCVVEDEKVSVDSLQEQIEGIEEFVQSMDIAAFNKV